MAASRDKKVELSSTSQPKQTTKSDKICRSTQQVIVKKLKQPGFEAPNHPHLMSPKQPENTFLS